MAGKIYTLGYNGWKPADLERVVKQLDAVLVDIRFNPYSPNPNWQRGGLQKRFGEQYQHYKEFGNSAYKTGGIVLVDFDSGLAHLGILLATHNAVLMCACKDEATCHRHAVAERLRAAGYEVEALTPPAFNPFQPALF